MSNSKYHLRSMFLSAFGFGFGFILGGLVIYAIFSSNLPNLLLDLVRTGRMVGGVLLALLVAALGGAVAGAIGGLALCHAHLSTRWGNYAWHSALSIAITFGLVAIPLTLVVALLGFYELSDVSPLALMIPFGLLGLLFGAISGLVLGMLTVGRDTWRVVLAGAISFGLGGAGLGQWLFRYLLAQQDMAGSTWYLFGGLFVFGLMGGGGWGFLYSWLAHRRPEPALPSPFVSWFKRQVNGASLDHAMWFHAPVQIENWHQYSMDAPWTGQGRSFNRGSIYTEDGILVASVAQEGLMRRPKV